MQWFITIAFVAIAIYGTYLINPLPPYENNVDLITRLIGSIVWLAIFIGAAIASARGR